MTEKMGGKFIGFSPDEEKELRANMNRFLRMVDPEELKALPKFGNVEKDTSKSASLGEFDVRTGGIKYRDVAGFEETHFHELVHWIHLWGEQQKRKELEKYFDVRTKGEKQKRLRWGPKGYQDHWACSFDLRDDYAGTIYPGQSLRGWPRGVEMPSRHLQKLAEPVWFIAYWNNKREGKRYWREAFLECAKLLFA